MLDCVDKLLLLGHGKSVEKMETWDTHSLDYNGDEPQLKKRIEVVPFLLRQRSHFSVK